jgi:hypothetical protein
MTTYVDSKIITLTSNSATIKLNNSFLSSVRYELGLILKDEPDILHRQICLQSAQIPYSFYVINFSNQKLKINTTTFTIPVGNYNATTLITAILAQISATFPAMTITFNKLNGILTFTNGTNFTIYNDFQYSIGTILGMVANSSLVSVSNSLTFPHPLNLLGIKSLEVRSTTLSCSNISSRGGGQTTLLATIPVSAVPFGMIDYSDKGNNQMTFTNGSLDDFDIEIIDGESGEFINFNNCNWIMTFIIHLTRLTIPIQKTTFNSFESRGQNLFTNPENQLLAKSPTNQKDLAEQNIENPDLQDLNILLS